MTNCRPFSRWRRRIERERNDVPSGVRSVDRLIGVRSTLYPEGDCGTTGDGVARCEGAALSSLTVDRPSPLGRYGWGGGPLVDLVKEISASRAILDLQDDWDGEGSPGYAEATWQRAVGCLARGAIRLYAGRGIALPVPKIRKGPMGGIDLHWRTSTRELLVHIPADGGAPADYYGDDRAGGHVVKGTLDPAEENDWLLMWLATPR